ncbi:MAG: lysophospholipid acyltransferase family protein [Candidatus Omnitrophica bacterium]|nr:lysophospholipid acyltransferase family protein [Candidatus Omnitrophota bacterium]
MFNYILYKIGLFIALYMPLKIAYKLAIFISDLHYILAREDRKAVRDNLKVIYPEKSEKELRKIRLRMSRNFAKYLVDFFRFSILDTEYIKKNIKVENIEYYDKAMAEGKGVIALSAHLGNWELGAVVIALLGYPFWVVALPHKHKRVDNFFNSQRKSKGVKVIPLGNAARSCLNVLKNNEIVALVGDRDFNDKGIVMDFFGKPTHLPQGPAAFALKTGARIVPCFMFRNEDDSFTLKMEKPVEFNPTGDKDKDLKALVEQYKVIIENYIRKYVDQWYMFRRFWIQ